MATGTLAGSVAGSVGDLDAVDQEIAGLEARLQAAKDRRRRQLGANHDASENEQRQIQKQQQQQQQQHFLFLLSDSALPLGSFAFSSGLESFLAHNKAAAAASLLPSPLPTGPGAFAAFLPLSVASYAHASLPFVLAAHDAATALIAANRHSADRAGLRVALLAFTTELVRLDDTLDATIVCTVGRRASVAQGRALLSVWERAFAPVLVPVLGFCEASESLSAPPADPLGPFALLVKRSSNPVPPAALLSVGAAAHLPPLFGAVAALAALARRQTADVFMLAHVKALVSAAVRASLLGPYQAQRLLASARVQQLVAQAVASAWDVRVDDAGQTMPVVDLWMGRHEMLYSRIFNS